MLHEILGPAASGHANRTLFNGLAAHSNDHQIAPAATKFHPRILCFGEGRR